MRHRRYLDGGGINTQGLCDFGIRLILLSQADGLIAKLLSSLPTKCAGISLFHVR